MPEPTLDNVVESAVRLAARPATLVVGEVPHVAVPAGYRFESLEKLLVNPMRSTGSVALADTASFITYVNDMKSGRARIYCDADFGKGKVFFTAIFNDHKVEAAGWRDLRATYEPQQSEEWKRWLGHNGGGAAFTQVNFAAWIEENIRDIASVEGYPSGTQMLEMALTLDVEQDKRFKSAIRLQSGGVDLTFVDKENEATVKKMQLFDRFALGIPAFFNGSAYQLIARLRYRVREGACSFWYELIRPDLVVKDAVDTEIKAIEAATELKVLFGKP